MKIKGLFIDALSFTTVTSCSNDEDFKGNDSMN